MGFNKRYLFNDQVLNLLKTGGLDGVKDWLKKADAIIAESGASADVVNLLEDDDLTPEKIQEKVKNIIEKGNDLN